MINITYFVRRSMNKMRYKYFVSVFTIIIVLTICIAFISAEDIRPANQVNQETGYTPGDDGSIYSSDGTNTNDPSEPIRPASQTPGRGVDEQIRPANQLNQERGYSPTEGSMYGSGFSYNNDDDEEEDDNIDNSTDINNTNINNTDNETDHITNTTINPDINVTNETEDNSSDVDTNETVIPSSVNMLAQLSGTSTGNGVGEFVLNTISNTLSYDIEYFDLSTPEIGASINNAGGIIFALPLGMHKIGVWSYNENYENDIIDGNTFVKIRSLLYPDGETSGTIITI
jgi:hypothetical protein